MIKKNSYKYAIINVWCIYNLILYVLASNFPYWENVPLISWINSSIYFLLFLISIFIVFQDKYNRDIFINLSAMFIFYSMVIFTIFIGSKYLLGNDTLAYKMYPLKKMVLHFLTIGSLYYISLKYILKKLRRFVIYILSLCISAIIVIFCFYNFLMDLGYILQSPHALSILERGNLIAHSLTLLPIIIYGIFLYRYDRPNGEYINLVMVGFLFLALAGLLESAFQYFGEKVHSNSQFIFLIVLFLLFIILFKKLNYAYSAFGRFYEQAIFQKGDFLNIKLQRRGKSKISFFMYYYGYFAGRKLQYTISVIATLCCINISGIPLYLKINIFVFLLSIFTVLIFFTSLYHKRAQQNDVL